jgi:hypothetical protein
MIGSPDDLADASTWLECEVTLKELHLCWAAERNDRQELASILRDGNGLTKYEAAIIASWLAGVDLPRRGRPRKDRGQLEEMEFSAREYQRTERQRGRSISLVVAAEEIAGTMGLDGERSIEWMTRASRRKK